MILDSTEKSIVAQVLEALVTPVDFYASFIDTNPLYQPQGSVNTGTISESESELISPPAQDTQTEQSYIRIVKTIFITNRDADNHNIVFSYKDRTDLKQIINVFLQPNWSAEYEYRSGWSVYNERGVKVCEVITSAEGPYILGDGINKITVSPFEPVERTEGDLWIDTNVS